MAHPVVSRASLPPDGAVRPVGAAPGLQGADGVESPLRWVWVLARFDALGVHALHDALALRCRVFILEQGAYQDPDDADKHSWHLLGYSSRKGGDGDGNVGSDGPLAACLRIVDPGARFSEPSIGRVVTAPEWRGRGMGRALMHEALQHCDHLWPGRAIRISAQLHLQAFYAALGFQAVGQPYGEDDIPHIEMLRPTQHKETP